MGNQLSIPKSVNATTGLLELAIVLEMFTDNLLNHLAWVTEPMPPQSRKGKIE